MRKLIWGGCGLKEHKSGSTDNNWKANGKIHLRDDEGKF